MAVKPDDISLEAWAGALELHLREADAHNAAIEKKFRTLRAENERLRAALKECADDLEAEINARFCGTLDYPVMQTRYERDMGVVVRAREALEAPNARPEAGAGGRS